MRPPPPLVVCECPDTATPHYLGPGLDSSRLLAYQQLDCVLTVAPRGPPFPCHLCCCATGTASTPVSTTQASPTPFPALRFGCQGRPFAQSTHRHAGRRASPLERQAVNGSCFPGSGALCPYFHPHSNRLLPIPPSRSIPWGSHGRLRHPTTPPPLSSCIAACTLLSPRAWDSLPWTGAPLSMLLLGFP